LNQQELFSRPASSGPPAVAHIDGGARGNPGPAAYGVVICTPEGKTMELARYLGHQTNNFAEYSGLLAALEYALEQKFTGLKIFSDSELLVKQMKGEYRVKHPALKTLFDRANAMTRRLESFSIHHVLRNQNQHADRLVNKVLDAEAGKHSR
jgi:ribonuclease HI